MYDESQIVTVHLTADEAVALLRNRDSQWTKAIHLDTAEAVIAAAVRESLGVHQITAQHDYAIRHT